MRTLGIDFGKRRIGLALSDAGGKLATPREVLQIGSISQAIDVITKVIDAEGVERVVVGLPLNMDGTRGGAAKEVAEFGGLLAARGGVKVIFVDERLSTFQAEQDLREARRDGQKLTRKSKKLRLDAIAAANFLQDFLDGKLEALDGQLPTP
jgi:putative Holliday junction resolvase